jgi:hypothetical protein
MLDYYIQHQNNKYDIEFFENFYTFREQVINEALNEKLFSFYDIFKNQYNCTTMNYYFKHDPFLKNAFYEEEYWYNLTLEKFLLIFYKEREMYHDFYNLISSEIYIFHFYKKLLYLDNLDNIWSDMKSERD